MFTLELTENEVSTIAFAGGRYGWSSALEGFGEGTHHLDEHQMWEIREGIESDMEGGHDAFPMLDYRSPVGSDLADKLVEIFHAAV